MRYTLLRNLGTTFALLLVYTATYAQSKVDFGLFRVGNELEIRVKPAEDFDGIFSNLVYTIRWEVASGATLGQPVQVGAAATYMPIQKSGGVRENGPFLYQVYTGFGMTSIASTNTTWRAGQEYVIAKIPFTGNADFHLANDQWSKRLSSNAECYASLGGQDVTGEIYKGAETVTDQMPFAIMPNPTRGPLSISFPVNASDDMWFEIVSSSGQVVHSEKPNVSGNGYRADLDLSKEGAGVYHLRIHRKDGSETHRIVVN